MFCMRHRLLLILSFCFCLSSCAHRMRIETIPSGAALTLNSIDIGDSPLDINTVWWPLRQIQLKIELPGYRTQTIDIGKSVKPHHIFIEILGLRFKRLFGKKARKQHKVILVRKHNQAGTWLPDDAYRLYK